MTFQRHSQKGTDQIGRIEKSGGTSMRIGVLKALITTPLPLNRVFQICLQQLCLTYMTLVRRSEDNQSSEP